MRKLYFFILSILFLGFEIMGCGPSSENPSASVLQIFRMGENTPLEKLESELLNNELVLEARIEGQKSSVVWWSADPSMGEFVSEGRLKFKSLGRFMIGALSGENRIYIPVTVVEAQNLSPTPEVPTPQPSPG
ncbi:MAG: hypothetical protein JNK65_02580, partial [Deltaproteobacteria bacterium]|nr:hypothetical protein [Deltaproteobacteria bacterium]